MYFEKSCKVTANFTKIKMVFRNVVKFHLGVTKIKVHLRNNVNLRGNFTKIKMDFRNVVMFPRPVTKIKVHLSFF